MKNKDQIKAEILLKQELNVEENIARLIFPILKKQKTIYDAQTLLHGVGGYIFHELENRTNKIIVSDLPVDLSQEKEGAIRDGFAEILEITKDEKAEVMAKFMKRYGDMLGYYGSKKFLEQDVSVLNESDLIRKPIVK